MCYDEYVTLGGSSAELIQRMETYFTSGKELIRRLTCEDNEERNQLLWLLHANSSLPIGFSITKNYDRDWNSIYYDKSVGEIHSGQFDSLDPARSESMESLYISILGNVDLESQMYELPDIMTLFEPAD